MTKSKKYIVSEVYESFDELLNKVIDDDLPVWDGYKSSVSKERKDHSWSYGASLEDAVEMGLNGWKEGRDNMSDNLELANRATKFERLPDYEYDVAGSMPNIPLYVAGSPTHMMSSLGNEKSSKKTIEILVNVGASCGTDADKIMWRGASILSLVDKLEDQGISCELTACDYAHGGHGAKRYVQFMIKRAGQPMDIDRCAFILTHPALLRKILFRNLEQDMGAQDSYQEHGYGRVRDLPIHMRTGKVYFPSVNRMMPISTEHAVSMSVDAYEEQANGKDWDGSIIKD